jgi:hypothetical protein
MPNKRWIAVALVVLVAGLAALALFETTAPAVPVPTFKLADAGPLRLSRAPSSFSLRGAPVPTALVTPTTGGACITGTVVDAVTGAGLAGASFTVTTFAGAVSTTTDATGHFELERLTEDFVRVAEVSAEHHFPFRPVGGDAPVLLTLVEGLCITGLTVALVPRVEYRGEVLGPDGEPVEGARVAIWADHEFAAEPLTTAADGSFFFRAADGALVVATHPRFSSAFAVVDFRVSTTRRLTLRLGRLAPDAGPATVAIEGAVVDEADAGVKGAFVRVDRILSNAEGTFERLEGMLVANASGFFRADFEAPGVWRVSASLNRRVSPRVETSGGQLVLRMGDGATLTGTVRDADAQAIVSFTLLVQRQHGALQLDEPGPHHVIDPEGFFHVAGLAPGRYQVSAFAPGLAPAPPVTVDLGPGAERTVDFQLGSGSALRGSVVERDSQRPLPGARVSLEQAREEPMAALPIARTDERGSFTLQGLPEGRRSLFVAAEGHHARLVSVELKPGSNGPVVIALSPVPDGGTPQLELVGIGAVLKASGDVLVIERTLEGGGAAEAGLVAGDLVLSIDGAPTPGLGFAGAIERIRGAEDTSVTLEVKRASGEVQRVQVPRRRVSR